jgi:hypothetical protein
MNLKKIAAQAGIAGALGFAALGLGTGLAHADPQPWPVPGVPGHPGYYRDHDRDNWGVYPIDTDDWHGHHWVNAPWGDGPPPWGWGAPPPPAWNGPLPAAWGPPPPAFNYWGYNVQPVWDPGYNQWGFWLFGTWIPL